MPAIPPRHRTKAATAGPLSGETGQEALYLRFLSEKQVPVQVKLRDGEVVSGWIEYFDDGMIRLTREGKPNLFIYKEQIRTISELVRKEWFATLCRFAKSPGLLDRTRYARFGTFMRQQGLIPAAPPVETIAVQTEGLP